MSWRGIIQEFGDRLPVTAKTPRLTLHEGDTPLYRASGLADALRLDCDLFLKFEGLNPTGSFKDRGMALAVAKAMEDGAGTLICASTGNTSASAAAYAARGGLRCLVVIPAGHVALGKLAQANIYGAEVIAVEGNFDEALAIVRHLAESRGGVALVNSVNPYRIEGQKTAAFEVCRALGDSPDFLAIPVGNAGNISAYWLGFTEEAAAGNATGRPRLLGFQAAGSAPMVEGHPVDRPDTVATAIRIGRPVSAERARRAVRESEGLFEAVSDDAILAAQRLVAETEGVFPEPASAASVAGVRKLAERGFFPKGSRIVCVLTGNGLKDPEAAIRGGMQPKRLPADRAAFVDIL